MIFSEQILPIFFTQKYWPMLSVWKFMERAHQYYIQIRKMPGILSRKLINFFDTRKTPNLFKGHTSRARTTYKPERFFQKSCRILRQKCRRFLRQKYRRLFRRKYRRFFRQKYRRFFRHKNGKVKKFLQCLQCQLPLCSETYQQHRTPPKQQILVWKWQPCTALWQHNLFGLLCLAWLGKASRARHLIQSLWDCAVVVLVALSTPCACASAVESLLFSAASWQIGEHLWIFWTISWIFRGHSWKSHFEANFLGLEAAEDVQPSLNKFSTSQRVSDILATPTGSPGKKFFILETTSMTPSSTKLYN